MFVPIMLCNRLSPTAPDGKDGMHSLFILHSLPKLPAKFTETAGHRQLSLPAWMKQ
jgi:hypothetical protein